MKPHEEKRSRFFEAFSRVLLLSMRHKWTTIITTIVLFVISVFGMGFIERQFFPQSDRPELVLDWTLPQNSSIADTKAQMERFEETMLKDNPDVEHWSTYVGQGQSVSCCPSTCSQPIHISGRWWSLPGMWRRATG